MALKTDAAHFTKAFNIEDTAIVLIDHQIGTCGWVHSIDKELLEKNVNILATFATGMKMPLVLTSSMFVSLELLGLPNTFTTFPRFISLVSPTYKHHPCT